VSEKLVSNDGCYTLRAERSGVWPSPPEDPDKEYYARTFTVFEALNSRNSKKLFNKTLNLKKPSLSKEAGKERFPPKPPRGDVYKESLS
jgi:hypothetical protein